MLLFLLLLIVAGAAVAVYASQNTATHDVTLWQWHWSAVPDWVPVVLAAAVVGALFLLYMLYSGLVHGVRVGSMRRRVTTRESALNDLRRENQRLREENARVRSELRGMDRGVAATDRGAVAASTAADRPRARTPYRPRPTIGERVRAFFSGREPAGY
ncbi:MAG: hypothetical protein E6I84_06170 [Chloroflexi bacterium]|nr:MAG: hypothetical protein E6J32_09765 [Chloroflexota bacterium]TMD66161.1 MAG: hypothetical protein E6I84_06170 [Chloroflexota bacterium]